MRALTMMLMAAALVLGAAVSVSADCDMHRSETVSAIDSNGYAVVSINHDYQDVELAASDAVTLDSSGHWTAANVSSSSESMSMAGKSEMSKDRLYCFDSNSKFCAAAF